MSSLFLLGWTACTSPDPLAALRAQDLQLDHEVTALATAEAVVVTQTFEQALAADDPTRAVEAALHAGPAARARVAAWLEDLPPVEAAPLLARLADVDPRFLAAADAMGAKARHAAPPASRLGIRAAHGEAVLELLDERYVVTPDWTAFVAAGDARLRHVPGSRNLPDAAVDTRAQAQARLTRWVAEGGLPEHVVVAEWIEAGLRALDPHSRAVWPAEVASWEAHHAGVYAGVGLELDARAVVRWPIPDTPAFVAGLHQGDRLVAVDGQAITSGADAGERLRGPPGTPVTIEAVRGDTVRTFSVVRDAITPDTVVGWQRTPDNRWDPWLDRDAGVAFARVVSFRPHTDEAFDALFAPVLDEVRALVLDLRGCPGGDLDAAVQLADRFVAEGTLATLEGRRPPPPASDGAIPWNVAVPGHPFEGVPVAILVDRDTASSAEVVAGALAALAQARIVGERTFGKGSSQALVALEGRLDPDGRVVPLGFAVQVTNLRWMLPDGSSPDDGGLAPHDAIHLGGAGRWQALAARQRREQVRAHADGTLLTIDVPAPRDDLPVLSADPAVVRALLRVRERADAPSGPGETARRRGG